jgi:hypothetical protein
LAATEEQALPGRNIPGMPNRAFALALGLGGLILAALFCFYAGEQVAKAALETGVFYLWTIGAIAVAALGVLLGTIGIFRTAFGAWTDLWYVAGCFHLLAGLMAFVDLRGWQTAALLLAGGLEIVAGASMRRTEGKARHGPPAHEAG